MVAAAKLELLPRMLKLLIPDGRASSGRSAAKLPFLIYLWSPHMPLSVSGYHAAAAAAERLGVSLVALLDPGADEGYSRRVAREEGIPEESLHPVRSIELAFRDLALHAPSIQVFAEGRLVGPVVPGSRDVAGFEAAIRRYLPR